MNQMQGQLLAGRYRLADAIGSGGMGRVWRAHDELLHRGVAIKELTAALYVSESDQAILLARTRAEARAAARINHSAVVTVHDVLEHDGRPWIVMELVEGRSLADAVKEDGRIEPTEAARIGLWVLRALRAAHSAGVLHRDIKPGNVLLAHDGRVLLTDFGIAQIDGDTTITRTGEVVGSVDYLAPERIRGNDPGPSSDLWALGATLYTAVEGRSPFRRTSPLSTMQAVVEEEAGPPEHAGPLTPVIAALLRKDPAGRPTTAEAEQMLADVSEGRHAGGTGRSAVPPQYAGPDRTTSGGTFSYAGGDGTTPGGVAPPTGRNGAYTGLDRAGDGPTHVHNGHDGDNAQGRGYDGQDRTTGGGPAGTYGGGHTPPGSYGGGATAPNAGAAGGPYAPAPHPASGAIVVGPTPVGEPVRPRRRRLRTLALVVAVAALVGGGTAVVLQQLEQNRTGDDPVATSPDTSPSTPATGTVTADGVPRTWVEKTDPLGFRISVPQGWERKPFQDDGDLKQVDYTPDGGEHFIRIAIDTSPDFDDPHAHQRDLDQQLRRLVDYRPLKLERNVYRDREGSEWEYTWTAQLKDTDFPGPRHAIEETYIARDGTEYVLYISSPAEDWDATEEQFRSLLRSWREPGTTS